MEADHLFYPAINPTPSRRRSANRREAQIPLIALQQPGTRGWGMQKNRRENHNGTQTSTGAAWAVALFSAVGMGLSATAQEDPCTNSLIPSGCKSYCDAIRECAAGGDGSCQKEVDALDACMDIEVVRHVVPRPTDDDDLFYVEFFKATSAIIGGFPVYESVGLLSFPWGDQTPHCGYVGSPAQGDCDCEENEVKASVSTGTFCRPSCPSGQTWADGAAYGPIYEGGGTCAVNHCVNTVDGYTRLDARPSIGCFPDKRKDYVESFAEPFFCTAIVGGATGAACWFVGFGIGGAIACSAAGTVIDKIMNICPDFPDPRED